MPKFPYWWLRVVFSTNGKTTFFLCKFYFTQFGLTYVSQFTILDYTKKRKLI
jgi:hypothetical protein